MSQSILTRPFEYGIATHGDSIRIPFRKLGYATSIGSSVIDVSSLGGTYVFPTAGGIQMRVVSDNDADATGKTGVISVHINYLDVNYIENTETITLNGKTPVNTIATNILRINHFHTRTTGTAGVAVGNILLSSLDGKTNYAKIAATYNNSLQAIFTIPAGYNGYITAWQIGSGGTGTNYEILQLLATTDHEDMRLLVFNSKDIAVSQNNQEILFYNIPIKVPEKTDIKVTVIASGGTGAVASTGIHGWYELSTID